MAQTEGHRLLYEFCEAKGMNQAALARAVKRSAPTVFRWFQKRPGKPDLDTAILLKDLAGIPVDAWARTPERRKRKAA